MKYKVHLGNKIYEVEVEEGQAMLLDEYEAKAPAAPAPAAAPVPAAAAAPAAPAAPAPAQVSEGTQVTSPLPGNVLAIKVKVGDAVKAGDAVAVVEAMKMENEIAAPCDGVVRQIVKDKGSVVATGDVLLVI